MVAEDGCVGDVAPDEEFGEFEHGGLGVWCCFAVDLVAGQDDEIGFLAVENGADEHESPGVGFAGCTAR